MSTSPPFPAAGRMRDLGTIVLVNLTALGLIVHRLRDPAETAVRIDPAPTVTPQPSPTPRVLVVHVAGAVRRPAVVRVPEGARVADALAAAGGLAEGAVTGLNLAAPLADGVQVYVPRVGEAGGVGAGAVIVAPDAAVGSADAGGSAAPSGAGPIDLNRATAAELDALPGVGPALAARIVAWRSEHGAFGAVDDLTGVSGIGERTLERLRGVVVVR